MRWLSLCLLPGLFGTGILAGVSNRALAQPVADRATPVADRITQAINPSSTAVLPGSRNPHAVAQYDAGPLSPGTAIDGITISFRPSAAQQAALDALVKAQQTPGSPQYHQWLTPATYGSLFGLSANDLAKVESWLQSEGFNVESVAASHNSIRFSGTAEQVNTAFGTEMHQYVVNGERHYANSTQLAIPAALSGIVEGVRNLSDFRPHPMVRFRPTAAVQTNYTTADGQDHFLTPADVGTIYDVAPAYSSGYTGSGETIAVVGQSEILASDIEAFQTAAGLTVKAPTTTLVPGTGSAAYSSGDEAESDLDIEYSGGMAPDATIDFVYVGNNQNYSVFDSLEYAVDEDLAPIITISYGECETELSQSDYSSLDEIVEQGASQGQSIIAASGDTGSTGCWGTTGLTTTQQEALVAQYPASSAYATALGGTEFSAANVAAGNTTYWKSASGTDVVSSALSYIPETAWNDDATCAQDAPSAADALCSGGGGASSLTTRPSWQTGVTGIPSGNYRLVPDISLDASNVNAAYLFCTSDTSAWTKGQKSSCSSGFLDSTKQYYTAAGGTSFAAPIFAGMLAILEQETQTSKLGVVASNLYTLASNSSTYASVFHDTKTGGNQCTAGASYCSSTGESEYATTTGYDEATGLGSIDFAKLVSAWSTQTTTTLTATTTTVSPASTTVTAGSSDVITITVAPSSTSVTGTPTGTVSITVNGTTEESSLALTGGAATYTFSPSSTATDETYTIAATYSGDSTFAASTGSATVTVTGGTAAGSFTLSASPSTVTVAQGSSGTSTVTVTSQNSYAGTVNLAITTTSTSLETYGCYSLTSTSPAVTAGGTATETLTLYTSESACSSSSMRSFVPAHRTVSSSKGGWPGRSVPLGAAVLAGALLFGFRKSRKAWTVLGCVALLAVVSFTTGCGGSSGTATTSTSTDVAQGSYTVTVTGTDSSSSSLTASTTVTLTVD